MIYAPRPTMTQTMRTIEIQKVRLPLSSFSFFGKMTARMRAKLCCIASSGRDTEACPRETEVAGPASSCWRTRQRSAALLVAAMLSNPCIPFVPAWMMPCCPLTTSTGGRPTGILAAAASCLINPCWSAEEGTGWLISGRGDRGRMGACGTRACGPACIVGAPVGIAGAACPGKAGRKETGGVFAARGAPGLRCGVEGAFALEVLAFGFAVGRFGGCITTGRIRLDDSPAGFARDVGGADIPPLAG